MWSIDARLTLIALLPLPGVTVGTRYFGRAIHDRFERIQAQLSDMSAIVQEALAGVRVVRAYRQERAELARFARANDEYVRSEPRTDWPSGGLLPDADAVLRAERPARALVRWAGRHVAAR